VDTEVVGGAGAAIEDTDVELHVEMNEWLRLRRRRRSARDGPFDFGLIPADGSASIP